MTETPLADPIGLEVFSNRLLTITEDMGNTLVRSSFSSNIKERRDCSVALFDAGGRLVAQASHIPLHLGSLLGGVQAVLAEVGLDGLHDGDAFICNDPYLAGGTHLPDIAIVTPVFCDGVPSFFTANIGHHSDVGGVVPGSISGQSTSVFEEGIRIPLTRIKAAGEINQGLLRLIAHNSRDPVERDLDLRVQIATNDQGAAMVRDLVQRLGADAVASSIDDLLAYTRRRLQTRIAAVPDGRASHTAWLDDDGRGGEPVPIVATVRIAGNHLGLDFTGTGPEARGAMNVPESALRATAYYAVKTVFDPDLPPNSGLFDAVTITAPDGCLVNPRHPAAVGARSITCNKVARAILGAFADLLPADQALSAGQDIVPVIVFSGQRRKHDGPFVYLESLGGGGPATATEDGMDAIHVHMTNSSNLPVEALEYEYPLLVEEYALVADSGGAGTHRGGLGLAREIRARTDGVVFSARSDGHVRPAPGARGGQPGRMARLIRNPGTDQAEDLSSKTAGLHLLAGERIRIETPGGGGLGPPEHRDAAALARDIADGKVSTAEG